MYKETVHGYSFVYSTLFMVQSFSRSGSAKLSWFIEHVHIISMHMATFCQHKFHSLRVMLPNLALGPYQFDFMLLGFD